MKEIELSGEYLVNTSGTSDGSQDKYKKDDKWYKIDGREKEGYNEELVSGILEFSNLTDIQFVKYEQVLINGKPGCASKDFCLPGEEDVSIYRLYANVHGGDIAKALSMMDMDDAIEYTIDFVKEQTGLDITEYLANTIALDQLILNTDRHMNNFCVIHNTNNDTFRMAPIFDNGRSFFCGDKKFNVDLSIRENLSHLVFRPFSASANLMVNYLRKYQTLKINRNRLMEMISSMEDGIAKSVLQYQIKNPDIRTLV